MCLSSPRAWSLARVSLAVLAIAACAPDAAVTAPDVEPPEPVAMMSNVALRAPRDRSGAGATDAIAAIRDRLVPSLGDYGVPLSTALNALYARPNDPAASVAVVTVLETIGATLPLAYHADLDAIRLELAVVALR